MIVTSTHADVARRAYELFLARGAGHGLDLEDWLKAELQLKASGRPPAKKQTTTSAKRRPGRATRNAHP